MYNAIDVENDDLNPMKPQLKSLGYLLGPLRQILSDSNNDLTLTNIENHSYASKTGPYTQPL